MTSSSNVSQKSVTTVSSNCMCRIVVGSACICGTSCLCVAPVRETVHARVAPFVVQLYRLVSDRSTNNIVEWLPGCKDKFVVHKIEEFSRVLLPKFYNHSNWNSFIRQLNNYGFKRVIDDDIDDKWVFSHASFLKEREDLLSNVARVASLETSKKQLSTKTTTKQTKRRVGSGSPKTDSAKTKRLIDSSNSLTTSTSTTITTTTINSETTTSTTTTNTSSSTTDALQSLNEKLDRCLKNQELILQGQEDISRRLASHEEECALNQSGTHRSSTLRDADLSDWLSVQK